MSDEASRRVQDEHDRMFPLQAGRLFYPKLSTVSSCRDDECKTHLYFEFISHVILCILYPYSCKTHKISSKLGFVGLLMKSK